LAASCIGGHQRDFSTRMLRCSARFRNSRLSWRPSREASGIVFESSTTRTETSRTVANWTANRRVRKSGGVSIHANRI
jgi:hypothetical protein